MEAGIAAIHDAARCLVPPAVIDAAVCGAREHGCGVAAIPMRDTVRDAKGTLLPRETLFLMQTPQAFDFARILAAYEAAEAGGFQATDDCAVYAAAGYALHFTEGSIMNQKLTYRQDLPFFRAACGASLPRVGFGEDTHALVPGRKLVLGGVEIPHETGLLGHSDADALTHAVIDALLGAAALGDIGMHFPDTDARYRGISSLALLRETAALLLKYENCYTNTALMNFDGPYQIYKKVFTEDMGALWVEHNIADKIMFGSGSPRIRPVRSKRGLDSLGFSEETLEKIYAENAERFLGRE